MSTISDFAEAIHRNLQDKSRDDVIFDTIRKNNLKNRIAISQYYQATYESSLFEDIKNNVNGDFGYCAAQLFLSPLEFCLHHLKLGLKKNNECVFEILTSKTPEELKIIEKEYIKDTGHDLKSDITKTFNGSVGRNLLNLFSTHRIKNPKPKKSECENYANILRATETKNWTDNENLFKEIFIQRSPEELILIARYYLKSTGNNLIDIVNNKIKGKSQILLKEILYNNIMPHELYAEKIYLAIRGAGTNEEILSRSLVSRCEIDMKKMREVYQHKYKVTMREDIIGDTSGFYQKLCIYLCEK
jgi:hypothetical protein